ncbi:MAG: right-handed parallel beta-helix repeat-containing protein [Archangium sp.]|nr:right-handed parallel beta-helix repeat-containing protein [Archangium sp.]
MRTQSLALAFSSCLFVLSAGGCACNNVVPFDDDAGTGGGSEGGGTGTTGGGSGGGAVTGGGGGVTGGGGGVTGGGGGVTGGGGGVTGGGGGVTGGGGGVTGGGGGGSVTGGGGGVTGGGGGACTSDPGCTAAAMAACDPAGSNMLGTCVDVGGGCLKVQSLAACPSTLQTCASGTNACACPAGACTPGASSTSCASATSVVACALDVPNGCGIYPATGAVACAAHQACTGAAPAAACTCVVDPFCSAGAGTYCNSGNTGTIGCAVDGNNCTFQNPAVLCAAPQTCSGAAPGSACSCPAIAAAPVTGGGCATVGARACETGNTNMILTCTANGGCNSWQQTTSCAASSLVCGTRSGAAACECGPNTSTTFYADAVNGSAAAALPFPSGLQSPAQCRFRTLTSALTLANAAVVSGGSANVIATGATSTTTVTFNAESFPLVLQPNVTLSTTDAVQAPGNYVVAFNGAGAAAFTLHDASTVTGMLVQQVSGAGTAAGVTVACPNTPVGPVRVSASRVMARPAVGGTSLANGIVVSGTCSAILTNVDLRNAAQAGLLVNSGLNTPTTSVVGGTYESNLVGAQLNRGIVTMANLGVRASGNEGILVSPVGGEVRFTQTGGVIENNGREGLRVQAGSGATVLGSPVSVTDTEFRNNGASSSGVRPGITIQARLSTFSNVNVHDNVGGGITVASAGLGVATSAQVSGTSRFDTNGTTTFAGSGANVGALANLIATQATFNGNRGAGVHVSAGGSATLQGGSANTNGAGSPAANGIEIEAAGSVVLERGVVVQNNVNSGIRTFGTGGTVTINGTALLPIDVSRNGIGAVIGSGSGALFANTTVTATGVAFHDNGRHGVQVNNTGLGAIGAPISITSSTFTNNVLDGLRVEVSERTAASTNSLNVSNSVFTGSNRGITVAANAGNVWASFQGNTVTGHADTGIYVTGTAASNLSFTGNTIVNNRVAPGSLFGGFAAGGVVFFGTNPTPPRFSFFGNVIHHNAANQILAVTIGGGPVTWDLNGSATAACVNASANTIACYNGVPTPSSFVGIITVGATVLANGNSWQNPIAPVNGTDFASAAGGVFLPSPPIANCPPSTITCP